MERGVGNGGTIEKAEMTIARVELLKISISVSEPRWHCRLVGGGEWVSG